MCEPATIAAVTMAIVGAGSAVAQHQSAEAQAKINNNLFKQNKENAYAAMRDELLGIQNRQSQETEAASQAIQKRRRQEMEDMSSATVAAGEAGVTGLSVERVLRDIGAVASRDVSTVEQNRDWTLDQLTEESRGIATKTESRIYGVARGIKPSAWATGFKIAGSAANAYSAYSSGKTT